MIRLIALDMDGTVLSPNHTISERNRKVIQTAKEKGIEVMIITGRGYKDATIPVKAAGLQLSYICLNGSEVRDEKGKINSSTYILQTDLKKIVTSFEKESVAYDLFIGDFLYTRDIKNQINMYIHFIDNPTEGDKKHINKEMQMRVKQGLIQEVDSYEQLLKSSEKSVYKVLGICSNEKKLMKVKQQLTTLQGLSISSSGIGNIEINNHHAQKGIALEKYASKKGIAMEEIMAIGDNYNDISMLERVGYSVAMENAPEEVKRICTRTTATNEHDGVAIAIEEIL
jgi:Cof subfamily protein (haloacid dehalogenase superfamily)